VTTPTQKIDPGAAPQPKVAGSSEEEDEVAKVAPPPQIGTLTGTMQIDGKAGGAFGLVTLEPASGKWKPRTPKRGVIEQRGREFLPRVAAISVGSTLAFPNFDTVFHNVFSTSPSAMFDLGIYKVGEAREYTFTKEGIVRLGCNLHANMSAYIAVVSAPSYVVTTTRGASRSSVSRRASTSSARGARRVRRRSPGHHDQGRQERGHRGRRRRCARGAAARQVRGQAWVEAR